MAIAAVQRKGKGTSATSVAIGSGDGWATPTAGNLLVVTANSDATVTITDIGTAWTPGPSVVDGNGAYVWYKTSQGTESTITCTPSVSDTICITTAEYSGLTASPFDVSNSSTINNSSGNTTTAAAVTTTADGDLVIAAALIHLGSGSSGGDPTSPSWTNSFVNQITTSSGNTHGTADCYTFYAELMPAGTAGSVSTSASWTGNVGDRQQITIAFKAAAAASIPYATPRYPQGRDYGEVQWLQRERRDANTTATAANPLVSPLDSAWQAGAGYWHLYGDAADAAPRTWQSLQRNLASDPSLLGPAATDPLTVAAGVGGDLWRRYNTPDFADRREVLQQRPYTCGPALLATALLETELLGGADTGRHYLPAAYTDRREVPQQRPYASDPLLLTTAELENELLGSAEDLRRRYLQPAFYDRREVPQQRLYVSDPLLLLAAQLENELLGGADTGRRYLLPATHGDRRGVPQQRPYMSDPSFYPTIAPIDPLSIAWGAGGTYWLLYNTPALQVDRRKVPQQRRYICDPALLATALLENELLGGADVWRHGQVFTDRRSAPGWQPRWPDPLLLNDDPLSFAAGAGGDLWRRYNAPAFADRRWQPTQPRVPGLPGLPAADPLLLAAGVGGDLWRRVNTPAYGDRREVPQQPARQVLYFDAGPGTPPLTLAWGAGGSLWHLYNRRWPVRTWWPQAGPTAIVCACMILRPFTGTTARPGAGATGRPDTGITADPCC